MVNLVLEFQSQERVVQFSQPVSWLYKDFLFFFGTLKYCICGLTSVEDANVIIDQYLFQMPSLNFLLKTFSLSVASGVSTINYTIF